MNLKTYTNHLFVTTDDGSLGSKGFVTEELIKLLNKGHSYDHIFCNWSNQYDEKKYVKLLKNITSLQPLV